MPSSMPVLRPADFLVHALIDHACPLVVQSLSLAVNRLRGPLPPGWLLAQTVLPR